MNHQYDIIVIGSGPGGYSAAVAGARLGAKVCLIEKDQVGGICVNKGCIPTKAILHSVLLYNKLKNCGVFGIKSGGISFDYDKIIGHAGNVILNVRKNVEQVISASKIDLIQGQAELISGNSVKVNDDEFRAKKIIVATGSKPKSIKNMPFDGKKILSSEMFLGLSNLPKSVLIAGAGVIGCEWAGILAGLGISVTLTEAKNKILPEEDDDLTRVVETNLKKMGVEIRLNTFVDKIEHEKVIICIGRDPATDGMKNILETKEGGWIKVNEFMQSSVPDVYAVGDVIGPPLLAYTADREGKAAVYNAMNKKVEMRYEFVPRVIFSMPEMASVGIREHENNNVGIARAFFKGLGKAIADGVTDGHVKIIYDKSSYKLLGAGIVGKNAGELINEPALALKYGLTVKEWSEKIWPHPVFSEIFGMALEKIK